MEGYVSDLLMPDEEDISAFIAVLRFFVLKQEKSSFRSLSNFAEDHDLSARWKGVFQDTRDEVNARKSATHETKIPIKDDGDLLTDSDIFDIFVNGNISHCEMPKRERYQRWQADADFFKGVTFRFLNHILGLSHLIFRLACATELEEEGRSKPWIARNSRIPEGPLDKIMMERGWNIVNLDKEWRPRYEHSLPWRTVR